MLRIDIEHIYAFLKHTNNIEKTRSLTNSTSMRNISKLKILFAL